MTGRPAAAMSKQTHQHRPPIQRGEHSRTFSQGSNAHEPLPFWIGRENDLAHELNGPQSSPKARQELSLNKAFGPVNVKSQRGLLEKRKGLEHRSGLHQSFDVSASSKLPPLPPRRRLPSRFNQRIEKKATSDTVREEVQARPYSIERPKNAPQLRSKAVLDFYPWEGDQPENALSEQTVTQGYYDKTPISSNESGSARPLIWSSVKHKSGLQILSSLYVSSLDQRLVHSTIRSKSTFKPPPRVTLTDAKREAWLKDLSDSRIPLRRLSRTIPHGIRGRSLLDHSLTKNIPTWRAVWLAKCVGANEIRATRRKGTVGTFGTGGETKWVRDWTANVQQFIESLIEQCGSDSWTDRMAYGLQLVAHIYTDRLVDKDIFIDWIITATHQSEEPSLPVWIMLVKTYWEDMTASRRRGKALAIALLDQFMQIQALEMSDAWPSIQKHIRDLLHSLLSLHPDCLILHNLWPKYQSVIASVAEVSDEDSIATLGDINRRNSRFYQPDNLPNLREANGRCLLVPLLEKASSSFDPDQVASDCLDLSLDQDEIVSGLLHWATARTCRKPNRVYLVARVLRRLSPLIHSLDASIMSFLGNDDALLRVSVQRLYHVIAELVRSRHFSVAKYLQWLLAKGKSICRDENMENAHNLHADLLDNIPLSGLQHSVLNLRAIVLTKLSRPPTADLDHIAEIKLKFSSCLDSSSTPSDPSRADLLGLEQLSGSKRFEIARWVRKTLSDHRDILLESGRSSITPTDQLSHHSLHHFHTAIRILEALSDYPTLADVLHIFVDTTHIAFLDRIAEYFNFQLDLLQDIGALNPLFSAALERLFEYQRRTANERPLLISLASLASRLPHANRTAVRLNHELSLCEATTVLAAYSPVSDQMAEALQSNDPSLVDSIEQLFNSGTSMDRVVFDRIFKLLAGKLVSSWTEYGASTSLSELLCKLKAFDNDHFEILVSDWLRLVLPEVGPLDINESLLPLISQGVVTLQSVLTLLLSIHRDTGSLSVTIIDIFGFVSKGSPAPFLIPSCSVGRLESVRSTLIGEPALVSSLVERVVNLSTQLGSHQASAIATIQDSSFPDTLQRLFRQSYDKDELLATISSNDHVLSSMNAATGINCDDIFCPEGIRELLHVMDDFNVELCQVILHFSIRGMKTTPERSRNELDMLSTIVTVAAETFDKRPLVWCKILKTLTKAYHDLHSIALAALFESLRTSPVSAHIQSRIQNLLGVVTTTDEQNPLEDNTGFLEILATFLEGLLQYELEPSDSDTQVSADACTRSPMANSMAFQLEIILELLSSHHSVIQHHLRPQPTVCRLVSTLCLVLTRLEKTLPLTPRQFLIDAIALVSDHLSQESRTYCAQTLSGHQVEGSVIDFLLGKSTDEHETLEILVADSVKPAGTAIPGRVLALHAYPLRPWEMVQDSTPVLGENDTSISLSLFDAKRSI